MLMKKLTRDGKAFSQKNKTGDIKSPMTEIRKDSIEIPHY